MDECKAHGSNGSQQKHKEANKQKDYDMDVQTACTQHRRQNLKSAKSCRLEHYVWGHTLYVACFILCLSVVVLKGFGGKTGVKHDQLICHIWNLPLSQLCDK